MKFSVSKDKLLEGLSTVQNGVSTRTTIPILSNVLLQASDGEIRLTTTDLDVGIRGGSVATLQEWSDMLSQCSLRHRFPVCSSGGNSNRKSSYWRLVGICVFPCRTGTSRSCSPSEVCTPITSRCGVGSSGMPQKWNDVCALGSDRPTTVGEWPKPTSGSRASGSIYTGLLTPAVRRSTSFCRLNATQQRPSAFSLRLWAERTIRRRGSSTPTSTPVIHRLSCGSKPRRL